MLKNRIVSKASAVAMSALILTPNAVGQCEPAWSALGIGMDDEVLALTVFDDGSGAGPGLYAGGRFSTAGGVSANNIAKWDGAGWSALGSGVNSSVAALAVFDDGSGAGPALYAGGHFTTAGGVTAPRIAKWDGAGWSALGSGMDGGSPFVSALTVFDDGSGGGPALYAGGGFTTAGGVTAPYIAKWDGAAWSGLGSGMGGSLALVNSLTTFDDGSGAGPALYAGGSFTTASGVAASAIAKWDGAAWSSLGSGMGGSVPSVASLTVFDDGSGSGPALYAGGVFITAGGVTARRIAKWDGAAWSALGSGMGGTSPSVTSLTVFDDGSGGGPTLYAGGYFTTAGGAPARYIAKWDGAEWSALAREIGPDFSRVFALTVFDDGSGRGPALHAGGRFTIAGGLDVNYITRWGCDTAPCEVDCDESGELDFFDFLCFQNEFATGAAYADCDDSGAHDFFDFLCFQNAFAGGCP
jgi:hypothetical protein